MSKADRNHRLRVKRKATNRRWLAEYLTTHPCVACGSMGPDREFHHRNPSRKKGSVSWVKNNFPLPSLKREVSKCDVVCRACHVTYHRDHSVVEKSQKTLPPLAAHGTKI